MQFLQINTGIGFTLDVGQLLCFGCIPLVTWDETLKISLKNEIEVSQAINLDIWTNTTLNSQHPM